MKILNGNDDPTVFSASEAHSKLAMATIRGEMYRSEEKDNQDCIGSFSEGEITVDILCDGLGGYADQNGELAARFCCEEAGKETNELSQKRESKEFLKTLLKRTVESYKKENLGTNAGTTLLLMITMGSELKVYHLGDSRAMFFRPNGEFITQTKDHKPLAPEERFMLTKYVSQTDPEELFRQADELRINREEYPEGLVAILMSDGITDNLKTSASEPECATMLSELIRQHQDPSSLCSAILKTANDRMALRGTSEGKKLDVKPDNSACLVRWFQ